MAIDINGYNATFKAFTEFATKNVDAGRGKAIARAPVDVQAGPLTGRSITAATTDSVRGLFKWFRKPDEAAANNATRELFRNAIVDMFGGESKIPASVKKAMLEADYGKGKPLTARRIMAVKTAIDASGTTEARKLDSFHSSDTEQIARSMGFVKSEMPKLARTAHLYAQAAGVDEMTAMKAVAEPGSKPNRLMQYGGRFLESAQNFADGLRLMDSYAEWSRDLIDTMAPVHKQNREVRDYSTADTPTKLNINSKFLNGERMRGIEKFVFEELAANPAHDLSGKDPEKLFGFKNNAAMRFIGRDYGNSVLSTIANIPPAKRAVIYAAYDLFTRNVTNAEEAHEQTLGGGTLYKRQIDPGTSATVLARLMRNFDRLEAMYNKGTLTARNIIDKFFPDIQDKGNYDCTTLKTHFDGISILIRREEDEDGGNPYSDLNVGLIENTMNNCGTTLEETADALRNNRMPPIPKMLSTGSIELEAFDGTTTGGRKLVAADADRPQNYVINGNPRKLLKDPAFGFSFPDGTRLETNGKHMDKIPAVCDKVENLCGRVHVAQANSVMMMLSQSGLSGIRGGIPSIGLRCDEHSAIDYSLLKDAATGAVTIRYESPAELPVHFSWTATVDVDGNVTSTPIHSIDAKTKTAIKEACAQFVESQKVPEDRKEEYANAIAGEILGSPDAAETLEVLRAGVMVNGENNLRPPQDVAKRVAAIRDNVAELRQATGGNEATFKAGLKALAEFGGKPIPKGLIASFVKGVQKMDMSAMTKLKESSRPLDIHKAVHAFRNGLEKLYADTDAIRKTYGDDFGAPEVNNFRMFATRLVFAGMDENTRNNIHAAVNSPKGGQLMKFAYMYVADGKCEEFDDYDTNKKDLITGVAMQFALVQDQISDFTADTSLVVDDGGHRFGGVDYPSLDQLDLDQLDVDIPDLVDTVRIASEKQYEKEVVKG